MNTFPFFSQVVINILIEGKTAELKGGPGLIRALNVLIIKIVDRSEHTNVICAFMRLLRESVGNSSLDPKFVETVMKCLWKIIRLMNSWMDSLDTEVLLMEVHKFLKAYPSSYWKKQESDTPMRTVKTIIHMMAKAKGN